MLLWIGHIVQDNTKEKVYEKQFNASVLIKSAKETEDGKWIVSGPVASLEKDYDGDIIEKAALNRGLKYFTDFGKQVDWEHQYSKTKDADFLIGKGIAIEEVDGKPWLVTQLFKSKPYAQKLWRHLQDEGEAGYSIEGICKARSPKDHARIVDMEVHRVTISPTPKGLGQTKIMPGVPSSLMSLMKSVVEDVSKGDFCGWEQAECEFGSCDLTEFSKAAMIEPVDENKIEKSASGDVAVSDKCPDCGSVFAGKSPKRRFVDGFKAVFHYGPVDVHKSVEDNNELENMMSQFGVLIGSRAKKAGKDEDHAPHAWSKFAGLHHDLMDELNVGGVCPGCGGMQLKPHGVSKAVGTAPKSLKQVGEVPANNGGDPEKAVSSKKTCNDCGHRWSKGSPKDHFYEGCGKEFAREQRSGKEKVHHWVGRFYAKMYKYGGKGHDEVAGAWKTHVDHMKSIHQQVGLKGDHCSTCGGFALAKQPAKVSKNHLAKGAWMYSNQEVGVFLGWDNYLTRDPDVKGAEPILKSGMISWDVEPLGFSEDIFKSIVNDANAPEIIFNWARKHLVAHLDCEKDVLIIDKSMTTGEGIVQDLQQGPEALREQEMLTDGQAKPKKKKKKKNKDGTDSDEWEEDEQKFGGEGHEEDKFQKAPCAQSEEPSEVKIESEREVKKTDPLSLLRNPESFLKALKQFKKPIGSEEVVNE